MKTALFCLQLGSTGEGSDVRYHIFPALGSRDQNHCKRMPEFLQQMSIVFLWNVIDRFLNMPWIPIKMACKQTALKQYSIVIAI